ncbi:20450_t:CDS:1, partial [Gigaspora rosea]
IHKSTNRLDDILWLTENGNQRVQQIHRKESYIKFIQVWRLVWLCFGGSCQILREGIDEHIET